MHYRVQIEKWNGRPRHLVDKFATVEEAIDAAVAALKEATLEASERPKKAYIFHPGENEARAMLAVERPGPGNAHEVTTGVWLAWPSSPGKIKGSVRWRERRDRSDAVLAPISWAALSLLTAVVIWFLVTNAPDTSKMSDDEYNLLQQMDYPSQLGAR